MNEGRPEGQPHRPYDNDFPHRLQAKARRARNRSREPASPSPELTPETQ